MNELTAQSMNELTASCSSILKNFDLQTITSGLRKEAESKRNASLDEANNQPLEMVGVNFDQYEHNRSLLFWQDQAFGSKTKQEQNNHNTAECRPFPKVCWNK